MVFKVTEVRPDLKASTEMKKYIQIQPDGLTDRPTDKQTGRQKGRPRDKES
jgi:hypothetical protein